MCVVIADVSGKGVPAAVFVSNTRAVLRAVAREGRSTPAACWPMSLEILFQDGRSDLYVTCVVAMVDTQQHTMVYANAGHPPGVMLRNGGGTHALGVGGPPLGLFAAAHYDEERLTLELGRPRRPGVGRHHGRDRREWRRHSDRTPRRAREPARDDAGARVQGAPRHGSPIAWPARSPESGLMTAPSWHLRSRRDPPTS